MKKILSINKLMFWTGLAAPVLFLLLVSNVFAEQEACFCPNPGGPNATQYVDSISGNDSNNGTSWATAKKSIGASINVSGRGTIIKVASGTYTENISLKDNIKLLGGYTPQTDTRTVFSSIIQAKYSGPVVKASNVRGSTIEGFTITGGNAPSGGGIFVQGGNLTIKSNRIERNEANAGGGVYLSGFGGQFIDNNVNNNTSSSAGGGVYCTRLSQAASFSYNIIANNSGGNCAGGLYLNATSATIANNDITANSASGSGAGGGAYISDFSGTLINNLISDNSANVGAGAYLTDFTTNSLIINCTIANNTANGAGGGFFITDFAGQITNSIIYHNTSSSTITNGTGIYTQGGLLITYSNVQEDKTGTGNINSDPLFTTNGNPRRNTYILGTGSPCIDTGDPAASDNDLDDTRNDMGYTGGPQYGSGPLALIVPTPPQIDLVTIKSKSGKTIARPTSNYVLTVSDKITLTGTASDDAAGYIQEVTWCNFYTTEDGTPKVASGTASGTTGWTATIPLGVRNEIYVQAIDNEYSCSSTTKLDVASGIAITLPTDTSIVSSDGTTCPNPSGSGISKTTLAPWLNSAGATDSYGNTVTVTNNAPDIFPNDEKTTVTFSAADSFAETVTKNDYVTPEDNLPPTATYTGPATCELSFECDGTSGATINNDVDEKLITCLKNNHSFADNCSDSQNITVDVSNVKQNGSEVTAFETGTGINYNVTFIISDAKGNSDNYIYSVTPDVKDTTPPEITCPDDLEIDCVGCRTDNATISASDAEISDWLARATATDLCDDNVTITNNAPTEFLQDTETTVTFTATDSSGNSATCSAKIIIKSDQEAPTFTSIPGEVTVSTADVPVGQLTRQYIIDNYDFTATATDNCVGTVEITDDIPNSFKVNEEYEITFTATDICGNTKEGETSFRIDSGNNPSIQCPASISVAAGTSLSSLNFTATATDHKGNSLEVTAEPLLPDTVACGTIEYTFTATDNKGRSSSCTANLTGTGDDCDNNNQNGNEDDSGDNENENENEENSSGISSSGGSPGLGASEAESADDKSSSSSKGNRNTQKTRDKGDAAEDEAVELVIIYPPDGSTVDVKVITVEYMVNGIPKSRSWRLQEGNNLITITETVNGKTGSDSITVIYSKQNSIVKIISPSDGTLVGSTPVRVTYSAGDTIRTVSKNLYEGQNTITIRDRDEKGKSGADAIMVTLDSTPPKVVITEPENGVTLAVPSAKIKYTLDGKSKTVSKTLQEGINVITVEESDNLGRKGSDTVTVKLIPAPPKVIITSPANGATVASSPITVTYTVNGKVKTVSKELDEGKNTVGIVEKDKFGRKGKAKVTITYNPDASELTITEPENTAKVFDPSITVKYKFNGTTKSISKDLVEGPNTITVQETGIDGVPSSDAITVILDSAPPAVAITSPKNKAVVPASPITVTYTVDNEIKKVSRKLKPGLNTITIQEIDLFERSGSAKVKVIYDPSAPKINIRSPEDKTVVNTTPVTVAYTVDGKAKSVSWDLSEGLNHITIQETDIFGRIGSDKVTVTLQISPLVCPKDLTVEQTSPKGAKVSLKAVSSDPANPIGAVTSNMPKIFPPGTTTVTFNGKTLRGGTVRCSTTVTVKDTNPPKASLLLNPKKKEYPHTTPLSIAYIVKDKVTAKPKTRLEITTGKNKPEKLKGKSPIAIKDLAKYLGDNVLTLTATDKAGNKATATAKFKVVVKVPSQNVTIKPQVLKKNGAFTVTLVFPKPYDVKTITNVTADGAPADEINFVKKNNKAVLKFKLKKVTATPIDTKFEIRGEFVHKGSKQTFVGYAKVKKIKQ